MPVPIPIKIKTKQTDPQVVATLVEPVKQVQKKTYKRKPIVSATLEASASIAPIVQPSTSSTSIEIYKKAGKRKADTQSPPASHNKSGKKTASTVAELSGVAPIRKSTRVISSK